MQILAFSDIHNNVGVVERLRETEDDLFDAVVLAGDIGGDEADKIFRILSDYSCPIFYVYGNWDNKLPYSKKFSRNCFHLHNNIFSVKGYTFAGFSGCPTHWGENPIAKTLSLEVDREYCAHLQKLNELRNDVNDSITSIRAEIDSVKTQYNEYVLSLISQRSKKYGVNDEKLWKTKRKHKDDKKVKRFERELKALNNKEDIAYKPLKRLKNSKINRNYIDAMSHSRKKAEEENRKLVVERLKASDANLSKTFFVAHERLYKTHTDMPGLYCHLFGHRHGFKHTVYKGTNFINVSVLDDENIWGAGEDSGTYCILKPRGSELEVIKKSLNVSQ